MVVVVLGEEEHAPALARALADRGASLVVVTASQGGAGEGPPAAVTSLPVGVAGGEGRRRVAVFCTGSDPAADAEAVAELAADLTAGA